MSTPFDTELDRLAVVNGVTRAQVDTIVFETRARIFAQVRRTATDEQVLDGVRTMLAAVSAAGEGR
jgi:hypothetical protein